MIRVFCEDGLPRDAKQLFLKMKESGCLPNAATYNVLLHGYLRNQLYDDIKMLLLEMDERGYLLTASTLSLLQNKIADKTLDSTLLELVGKLVTKKPGNDSCFAVYIAFYKGCRDSNCGSSCMCKENRRLD